MFYSYGITSSAGFLIPLALRQKNMTVRERISTVALYTLSVSALVLCSRRAPNFGAPLEAGLGAFASTVTMVALYTLNVRKEMPNLKVTALGALILSLPAALSASSRPQPFNTFCMNGAATILVYPKSDLTLTHLALFTICPMVIKL
ncbi:MAG: hypothetical protein KDK48_02880 [Chlamydiia bacterium]|nr:hypothetical protein [Chlamydiia bacterium]